MRKKKDREARSPRSFFIFIPFSFAFNIKMYDPERSYINLFTYIQKNSNPLSTCHVFPDTHVVILHFQKTCYKNFLHSFKHASYLFLCFTTQKYRFYGIHCHVLQHIFIQISQILDVSQSLAGFRLFSPWSRYAPPPHSPHSRLTFRIRR